MGGPTLLRVAGGPAAGRRRGGRPGSPGEGWLSDRSDGAAGIIGVGSAEGVAKDLERGL